MRRFPPQPYAVLSLLLAAWIGVSSAGGAVMLEYNRDIRPILSDNCFACHGPDRNARKGKLRLDQAEGAYASREGKAAIVPGKPELSAMVSRIFSHDPEEVMPPPRSEKKLSDSQHDTLKRWIEQGAKYQDHWSFLPPTRPAIPPNTSAGTRPVHPIDAFIRARLQLAGLRPSPPADPRVLWRRVSLDLTGLPPNPELLDRSLRSHDPRAYEKWVDALLNSPHYGERLAVYWMDLVRYADTVGFHGDMPVSVWPYRDYVINAFNRNLPFNQFTRDQIAGDLIPNAAPEQYAASAYNRLNRMSTEGGIQDKEYRAKYLADRVRTTSTAWMGATLACCECHDHKFDPFTVKDFYRFGAFFADLNEKGFYDRGYTVGDWGPSKRLATPAQQRQLEDIDKAIRAAEAKVTQEREALSEKAFNHWLATAGAAATNKSWSWQSLLPVQMRTSGGTTLTPQPDRSVVAALRGPAMDDYQLSLAPDGRIIRHVLVEWIHDDQFQGNGLSRSGDSFHVSEVEMSVQPKKQDAPIPVDWASARSDFSLEGLTPATLIDHDPTTSWGPGPVAPGTRRVLLKLKTPLTVSTNGLINLTLRHSTAHPYQHTGRFRVSVSSSEDPDFQPEGIAKSALDVLLKEADKRSPEDWKSLTNHFRLHAPELITLRASLDSLKSERDGLLGRIPLSLVSEKGTARTIRVLARGNWMDDSGEVVVARTPEFLRRGADEARVQTRLDLADWLVSRDNPLTARAFVNRMWKLCFGVGLTRTLDDLGAQGEWPSHPELLDWLAVEFMESGWDVKHLLRLIVTSETYRQSSLRTQELEERDPMNRWLGRQSSLRLDAEFVRDNALAISGLLAPEVGGPSVHPYQPEGYYTSLNFPKREYASDIGPNQYRRGLYTHWQRTFVHPSMVAFDAPSREECSANRPVSNTPLQALVLLNDPTYVEAAKAFAARILDRPEMKFESRMGWAFRQALGRPASVKETAVLKGLYEAEWARYSHDPAAADALLTVGLSSMPSRHSAAEAAAWVEVARAILNLHETITRN